MLAFYHQRWDTPDILTIEPLLNMLKLTLEWIPDGGNQARRLSGADEIRSVRSARLPPDRALPSWFRTAMLLPWTLSTFLSGADRERIQAGCGSGQGRA